MSFDVLLQSDNQCVVGFGPFTDDDRAAFPPDYNAATIDDDSKYDWLLQNIGWPPYAHLGADGQTFDLVEEWPAG
ncbi:MAG TPA: hypothetical protein VNG04_07440 [Candidatus Acidoferrum sp.]|nr:hypothetical protein [Candidatus Acidoferrum sp.]HXJ32356.1 hypothetical protein [Gemmatimonadales bacterium]